MAGCSLSRFEDATGLSLTTEAGSKAEPPPITTFLNRLLALPIGLQNTLFAAFEGLLAARIEAAVAAGVYDVGVETIRADQPGSGQSGRSGLFGMARRRNG